MRVGIAGLNSAWSCGRDGENGKLWVAGRWQAEHLLASLDDVDLSVALIHHPPGWYVEQERNDFWRHTLRPRFHSSCAPRARARRLGGREPERALVRGGGGLLRAVGPPQRLQPRAPRRASCAGRGLASRFTTRAAGGGWRSHEVPENTDGRGVWPLCDLAWLPLQHPPQPRGRWRGFRPGRRWHGRRASRVPGPSSAPAGCRGAAPGYRVAHPGRDPPGRPPEVHSRPVRPAGHTEDAIVCWLHTDETLAAELAQHRETVHEGLGAIETECRRRRSDAEVSLADPGTHPRAHAGSRQT